MLILKRLGVWVFETVFIAVLVGVFLYFWWGRCLDLTNTKL
jgi:hypothetical protein